MVAPNVKVTVLDAFQERQRSGHYIKPVTAPPPLGPMPKEKK